MKRNVLKPRKKLKPETIAKIAKIKEKIDKIDKIATSAINKRIKVMCKSLNEKNLQIKEAQEDFDRLKEFAHWYYKESKKKDEKYEVFLQALDLPNSNGLTRSEFMVKEIERIDQKDISKSELDPKKNVTLKLNGNDNNPVTPDLATPADIFSPLRMKLDNSTNSPFNKQILSESVISSDSSLNSSFGNSSILISNQNIRIHEYHKFNPKKQVTNKPCNDCFRKQAILPSIIGSGFSKLSMKEQSLLHHCSRCGMLIHECCRESGNRKICIPCYKIPVKINGNREIELADLCGNFNQRPFIPSAMLSLMNHIQTYGRHTDDLYRATGRNKLVSDLCEKLFEGKSKYLCRFDVQTAGNCLRFILRSLKSPLLSDKIINKLVSFTEGSSIREQSDFENEFYDCMRSDMNEHCLDTFVYLIIHLKLVSEMECRLDSCGLATVFMPSITSTEMAAARSKQLIQLIKMIIDLDFGFYSQFLCENIFFHHAALR